MLHMTLASNLLNAIGGSPVIDKPEFIPTFPGPLPGGIDTGLIVHLAPFSMEQLETYLSIESQIIRTITRFPRLWRQSHGNSPR